jgi:hypothetical protein
MSIGVGGLERGYDGAKRRLAKDYERLPETASAMSRLMLRRLARLA